MEKISVLMKEMTWPEVQLAIQQNKLLIFTAGTIEQHGPHLPLGVTRIFPWKLREEPQRNVRPSSHLAPNMDINLCFALEAVRIFQAAWGCAVQLLSPW